MIKTYKCPNCGADMVFDAKSQKMICHHCGYEEAISFENQDSETSNDSSSSDETKQFDDSFVDEVKEYQCPSCGATLITDLYTSATFCSYCGNPTLIESRLTGVQTPDSVIPFKISKEQAQTAYKNWMKKGVFAPPSFRSESNIEKITGIYVPFWLYDFASNIQVMANCTRIRRKETGDMVYTYTDHFQVYRDLDAEFLKVPTDASKKMPDDIMTQVEPYKYEELVPFQMPYLSGFLSEKYSESSSDTEMRAKRRVSNALDTLVRSTIVGYSTTTIGHRNTNINSSKIMYALLPVWIFNYRYKDKDYTFTMNGQTGKIVAKIPVSPSRVIIFFITLFLAIFFVTSILFYFTA